MVRMNILPLLKQRGKTKSWLYKQIGMSCQNFNKTANNQTKSIKLARIETLCQISDCTTNNLFLIHWDEET